MQQSGIGINGIICIVQVNTESLAVELQMHKFLVPYFSIHSHSVLPEVLPFYSFQPFLL